MIYRNADVYLRLDFILWSFVEFEIYAKKLQTIPELKTEIQHANWANWHWKSLRKFYQNYFIKKNSFFFIYFAFLETTKNI